MTFNDGGFWCDCGRPLSLDEPRSTKDRPVLSCRRQMGEREGITGCGLLYHLTWDGTSGPITQGESNGKG